ncbi:MAG: tRNA uridine-5-carboxymethylaminomethyl(34) synthesis GTPase MnmE [Bacillota bacterium]|jgi:tRNA modification GTPase|nr:tRNA uridine-5-carboxymethylaminomethyl(34) synthesis GTPase MnmE [Bacillota bacterium]HHU30062.1 tRNA uridine-5-carboxymethylaminomethyl(34) synthesis GTPase MnmE [Bacillota bacterium]
MNDDTIAAISTPPGEGGIGIVRLSGPQSFAIARKIISFPREIKEPESHRLYYGYVVDPKDNSSIDEALVSFMRSPRTYTREDVVEINCHGGIRPLARTLELVLSCGARLAEPGEFTQRGFLNGRLDLAQAEAVIQIIRAKTDTALRLGMNQLTGGLSSEVKKIRAQLLAVLARIEAAVDFPELHDVEEITRREIGEEVAAAGEEIEALLKTADKGKILREGLLTAIIGLPNVGKSSLLNALLREQRAIVTDVPGTTRDILEESVNIGGIALTVIDTAGIRKTENKVEKIGVERSRAALSRADLVLLITDITRPFAEEEMQLLQSVGERPCIIVANKADLVDDVEERKAAILRRAAGREVVATAAVRGQGLEELEDRIKQLVFQGEAMASGAVYVTTARHKDALKKAQKALHDLKKALDDKVPVDLLSVDLHNALAALGEITGETAGDDLLNEIFSSFCIGK